MVFILAPAPDSFFFLLSSFLFFLCASGLFLGCIMLAAVKKGDAKTLAELMRQDPGFNVNTDQDGVGGTLLHYACSKNDRSPMIPLLLAHPGIDVNLKDADRWTPFFWACGGHTSCVREMLKDSRVKVNEPRSDGYTPLLWTVW